MEVDTTPSTTFSAAYDFNDADVSIVYRQNQSEVLASLSGPTEVPASKRLNGLVAVTIHYYLENGDPINCEDVTPFITNMIDRLKFPRAGIAINLYQMRAQGSRLSTAINAATLALLDSAAPLNMLAAAVDVVIDASGELYVNPSKANESQAVAGAVVIFGASPKGVEPVGFKSWGTIGPEFYEAAVNASESTAKETLAFFRKSMQQRLESTNTK
uniref:RNase_PH domain-containing protein n=1 Tax=Panagrellus redivivus TaxID=6233 RepID=A0A7E4VUE6_PANRE